MPIVKVKFPSDTPGNNVGMDYLMEGQGPHNACITMLILFNLLAIIHFNSLVVGSLAV